MDRTAAVERVERLVETVERERMPVPVREIWVYGDVALGLDPVSRLDVYLTKDLLLGGERAPDLDEELGVEGIGSTVSAEWAREYPEHVRANDNGYAAPERCLAAHLTRREEPIHLEVCNASFEDNVTQRLRGAMARSAYQQILDPRGVCLWIDGTRSDEAFRKLRESEFAFPVLSEALTMIGMESEEADEAAAAVQAYRREQRGRSVRGDVV
jgi:hypothetical protein